jgi:hypothetical protein
LLVLEAQHGVPIALAGVVVGGGIRQDGPGMLGVWMSHEPTDFGLAAIVPPPAPALAGAIRTGLTEALLSDAEDDSYDLSWLHQLPSDALAAIRELRRLLEHDPDPIDRHFMFCELEDRLYRSRDTFASALEEYDETCVRHDAEMDGIRDALLAKFGKVPVLETYRQMTIRQQKIKNWQQAIWWTERGLELYGERAARQDSVDDDHREARADSDTEARRRRGKSGDRDPRVRNLRNQLRARGGARTEAQELSGLPLTRRAGRTRNYCKSTLRGHSAAGQLAEPLVAGERMSGLPGRGRG